MELLQKLKETTTRKVRGVEVLHPSVVIANILKFGDVSHAKLSGVVEGIANTDLSIANNYIIEVRTNDEDEFGTLGVLVQQGSNKLTVYSGVTAWACLNLSIFGAEFLSTPVKTDEVAFYSLLQAGKNNLKQQKILYKQNKEKWLKNTYSEYEWNHKLGEMLNNRPKELTPQLLHAVDNQGNKLYADMPLSDWKLYNLLTDSVKNESPTNRIKKTLTIEKWL